jgi:hypothetical protein
VDDVGIHLTAIDFICKEDTLEKSGHAVDLWYFRHSAFPLVEGTVSKSSKELMAIDLSLNVAWDFAPRN